MSAEHRKTKVINPGFQYRVAFTAVLVTILGINLFILMAALLPQLVGLELRLGNQSYYVIGIIELVLMVLGWRWSISATHRVAGPVYAIGRELEKLRDGNLLIRVNLRPKDEFKDTADSINGSIAHLCHRLNEIKTIAAQLDAEPSAETIAALRDALNALKTTEDGGVVGGGSPGEKSHERV